MALPSDNKVANVSTSHTSDHNKIIDALNILPGTAGVTLVSSNYTVGASDSVFVFNGVSTSFSLTLPDATTCSGRVIWFYVSNGSETITLQPVGGQSLNGFSSYSLTKRHWAGCIVSDGFGWDVLAAYGFTDNSSLDDGSGNMSLGGRIESTGIKVYNIKTKTGNYTVTTGDYLILCDTTSSAIVLTLPDATTCNGQQFVFKQINSTNNSVSLATVSAQTIDGGGTFFLPGKYSVCILISDGSNWQVMDGFGGSFNNILDDGSGDQIVLGWIESQNGLVESDQFEAQLATRTFTANTSAQAIFNASTNGTLTVASSISLEFECEFDLTALSASAHTVSFGLGGTATYDSLKYRAVTNTGAAGTLAAWQSVIVTTASATAITASVTTTTMQAYIKGFLRVNAGGTIIPQLTQNTNGAAAVVGINSRIKFWYRGSHTQTWWGSWT